MIAKRRKPATIFF